MFLGPSGCGKSTTLRLLAGLEQRTSGEIWIGGRNVSDLEPRERDIAMVFQNYALYPNMTIAENMGFGLRARKTPKDEIRRRVEEAARMLGMADLLDRKPRQLSGGQQQRVAIGRAIVRKPNLFLFDEPLSNLDAKLRVDMRSELLRLHRGLGATTVYVTHDQEEAMTMADQIVVMDRGRIEQIGTPAEIYFSPQSLMVARFVGSPVDEPEWRRGSPPAGSTPRSDPWPPRTASMPRAGLRSGCGRTTCPCRRPWTRPTSPARPRSGSN